MVLTIRPKALLSRFSGWFFKLLAVQAFLITALAPPAMAHEDHKEKPGEQLQQQTTPGATRSAAMQQSATAMHGQMGEMLDEAERDRASMSLTERLLHWLGRLHPVIVHFPIAFFPAALFTAVVGRTRQGFAAPVQFLVAAGGIIAPIAAVLGWLDAMSADPDPLLTVHRWLGTIIGIAGFGLAIWAWRKPGKDRGAAMLVALTVITAAIVVQGWYGGALVHGFEHLNW